MSDSSLTPISDTNFEDSVLKSELPVLVDFWAEWCGPCKTMTPILKETAVNYQGRLKIVTLNIDDNTLTTQRFSIRGIPTLMLFKNGDLEATRVGVLSKSQLTAFLDSNI